MNNIIDIASATRRSRKLSTRYDLNLTQETQRANVASLREHGNAKVVAELRQGKASSSQSKQPKAVAASVPNKEIHRHLSLVAVQPASTNLKQPTAAATRAKPAPRVKAGGKPGAKSTKNQSKATSVTPPAAAIALAPTPTAMPTPSESAAQKAADDKNRKAMVREAVAAIRFLQKKFSFHHISQHSLEIIKIICAASSQSPETPTRMTPEECANEIQRVKADPLGYLDANPTWKIATSG